jgi:hypothetical protein
VSFFLWHFKVQNLLDTEFLLDEKYKTLIGGNMDKSIAKQIHYDEEYTKRDLKLFDFPEDVVKELSTSRMVIHSDQEGNAFFITDTATYKIIKVENSNSILVKRNDTIDGIVNCHFELEKTTPSLGRLRELMKSTIFVPNEKSGVDLTMDAIFQEVTASKQEITTMLKSLKCLQIGEFWKMIDNKVYQDSFNMLLLCIQEAGYQIDAFRRFDVVGNIHSDYDSDIIDFILETNGVDNEDGTYQLYFDKIAQFKATQLFETQKRIAKDKFMKSWQESLAFISKTVPTLDMIKDFTVVGEGGVISYIDRDSMPTDPAKRLDLLFKVNPEWTESDLFVFMSDLIDFHTLSKTLKKTAKSKTTIKGKVYFK